MMSVLTITNTTGMILSLPPEARGMNVRTDTTFGQWVRDAHARAHKRQMPPVDRKTLWTSERFFEWYKTLQNSSSVLKVERPISHNVGNSLGVGRILSKNQPQTPFQGTPAANEVHRLRNHKNCPSGNSASIHKQYSSDTNPKRPRVPVYKPNPLRATAQEYNAFVTSSKELMSNITSIAPVTAFTITTEGDHEAFLMICVTIALLPESPDGHLKTQAELDKHMLEIKAMEVDGYFDTCSADIWIAKELVDPILDLQWPMSEYGEPLEGFPYQAWQIPVALQIDSSDTLFYLRAVVTKSSNLQSQLGSNAVILGQRFFIDSMHFSWKGLRFLEQDGADDLELHKYRSPFTENMSLLALQKRLRGKVEARGQHGRLARKKLSGLVRILRIR